MQRTIGTGFPLWPSLTIKSFEILKEAHTTLTLLRFDQYPPHGEK